ncbi:MAG: monovalent cation/H+ antiporter subunit D [Nevskiaceae bacterium]|nr:MAG: monovalent cation/H+ antiporter subunit D [Nevskiaceae bacterium]TBR72774.1 MAG: monovalent cation/H+ antiporter subunit D [Nevskiaceae bacterium]
MMTWLPVLPILLPLLAAALQLLAGAHRRRRVAAVSVVSCVALLVLALVLVVDMSTAPPQVYRIGDWPARFGIVLVVDRLSALMLLITAVLALAVVPHLLGRWIYHGVYLQPLVQLLLCGVNGAFLTGDLFNLFVFFEVLLAASYGLSLYGSGPRRVGASLHYIAINLAASALLLVGISLVLAATGSLNMAAIARQVPQLTDNARLLLHVGAGLLALAFLVKAAIWPLGFWLPRTYSSAIAPVAALFAIMTEVGVYVLLRLSVLVLGADAGPSARLGADVLLALGVVSVGVATIGVLGARELGKLAAWSVLLSSGTLVGAIGVQQPLVTAGALAYLAISVPSLAALFLLTGLIVDEQETQEPQQLEPYDPAGDALYEHEDERDLRSPLSVVIVSVAFFATAILLTGLPPFAGFLAKFSLLAPLLNYGVGAQCLFAAILLGGFGTLVAFCRAGIQIFWADDQWVFPRVRGRNVLPVAGLLLLCLAFSAWTVAPWHYVESAAQQIHAAALYQQAVLP